MPAIIERLRACSPSESSGAEMYKSIGVCDYETFKDGDKCKMKSNRQKVTVLKCRLLLMNSLHRAAAVDALITSAPNRLHIVRHYRISHRLALILYPGYFIRTRLDSVNLNIILASR